MPDHVHLLLEGVTNDTRAVVRYLLNNPVRAGLVKNAADYRWSGSSKYTFEQLAEHSGEWKPSW